MENQERGRQPSSRPSPATRALPPCALVVGSCAPDIAYALGLYNVGSHSLPGLITFCLPAGLLVYGWLELLALPALTRSLPEAWGIQWARFATTRGLPTTVRGWAAAALAILLGACTHLLWDGFTHRTHWPARLYADVHVGRWYLPGFLQVTCSIVGSILVFAHLARRYRTLRPERGGSITRLLVLLLPTLAAMALGVAWRLENPASPVPQWELWFLFWTSVRFGLLSFTVTSLGVLTRPPLGGKTKGPASPRAARSTHVRAAQ